MEKGATIGEAFLAALVKIMATRSQSDNIIAKRKEKFKSKRYVIFISADSPIGHWSLAKVIQVFPGKNGTVIFLPNS